MCFKNYDNLLCFATRKSDSAAELQLLSTAPPPHPFKSMRTNKIIKHNCLWFRKIYALLLRECRDLRPFACEEEADLKLPTLSHRQLSLAFRRRPHHYFTRFLCQQCYLTNIEDGFLLPFKITDWKLCTCYLDVIYASKGVFESVLFGKISFGF